jgi:DnaJ-class molecular chaperone
LVAAFAKEIGVKPGDKPSDVRKKFHKYSLKYHPDKVTGGNRTSQNEDTYPEVVSVFSALGKR